ncbi:hypothetical protein J5N97_005199 [Dioscorea zingiberensis]|uniref:EF-hand domain-containing protein n=1 Tax=Dioscorea zingiberensis TaxID=325984 RepID=A0A9D5D9R3_9LILI|nr:hypothetical protein J5N97_005199 [Dioscorea zingiberensis]
MSVEILDGETIRSFVEDEQAFNISVESRFTALDTDNNGRLSYIEMMKELMSLRVIETHFGVDIGLSHEELVQVYGSLFSRFDHDGDGTVDLEEFRAEMKEMMLAVAKGLGFLPVQMAGISLYVFRLFAYYTMDNTARASTVNKHFQFDLLILDLLQLGKVLDI